MFLFSCASLPRISYSMGLSEEVFKNIAYPYDINMGPILLKMSNGHCKSTDENGQQHEFSVASFFVSKPDKSGTQHALVSVWCEHSRGWGIDVQLYLVSIINGKIHVSHPQYIGDRTVVNKVSFKKNTVSVGMKVYKSVTRPTNAGHDIVTRYKIVGGNLVKL
ncbi:MAG: hypothetical protein ACOZEN_16070 [Thermodesulfobacteriota bacterium]